MGQAVTCRVGLFKPPQTRNTYIQKDRSKNIDAAGKAFKLKMLQAAPVSPTGQIMGRSTTFGKASPCLEIEQILPCRITQGLVTCLMTEIGRI